MFGKKKYSIAFSVSESDIEKAEEFHGLLLEKGISCYLYSKDRLPTLSRNLFEETLNIYMKKARHVLLVASKDFNKGTWATIEERIIELVKTKKKDYLILIKLDDVEIGWAKNIGYLQYKGDWKPILKDVVAKINESKRVRVRKRLLIILVICSVLIFLPLLFRDAFFLGKMLSKLTIPDMNKVVSSIKERSKVPAIVKRPVPIDKIGDKVANKQSDSLRNPPQSTKELVVGGRVEDEAGRPIENADVTLLGKTKKTDINGSFLFKLDVIPYGGEYSIFCSKEGYKPYNQKHFESKKNDIEIILKNIVQN